MAIGAGLGPRFAFELSGNELSGEIAGNPAHSRELTRN
jgi:hypothetical protein